MYHKVLLAFLLIVAPASVLGQKLTDSEVQELLKSKTQAVRIFANNPILVEAVRKQNAEKLSLETIKQRDQEWSSTKELTPFKLSLQESVAGEFLKNRIETNPTFNEAFLTDNQGANVAAYPATSDYWQGDEEKWTASFNGGNGQVFIGKIQQDESTGIAATQISAPVIDRDKTIGVLVVGVKLSYVEAKKARSNK
jgi:sensor histidine kinase regulating citrate/malate metabolism